MRVYIYMYVCVCVCIHRHNTIIKRPYMEYQFNALFGRYLQYVHVQIEILVNSNNIIIMIHVLEFFVYN